MSRADSASSDRSRHLPAHRRGALADFVAERGQVAVAELAERFHVSIDTIRRDLDQLDTDGLVIRTHGGAVSKSAAPVGDRKLDLRLHMHIEEKETIAALTARLVQDDSVIMLNGGTTTLAVVRHLRERRGLTIATNNLRIPAELPAGMQCELYVFGGHVRTVAQTTTGSVSFGVTNRPDEIAVRADLAIIGVGAVASTGFSTSNVGDAAMMAEMMDHAERVAVVADSSKFARPLFAQIAALDRATYLITDAAPPPPIAAQLKECGVSVITP
ncbi:DeoR/GlpR family DNA-binding transcription regulator [Ruania halotolerans]|uniref:DeoR/GlpR family DNA-binding transcription regulator n=1 Tax=Ruania halotolerans TaxID=2897773 RepID=UPI001E5B021D|nr:DeoR/GlpR family DNA-binding transcription regulator [Ruania halotolerans]UFU08010.1 DeoR/GlpR family DNA-binding transcription regulator [Ruania halotolerans]